MTEENQTKKSCPQCSRSVVFEYRPFCSARCKQLDLGKWFNESYVIAGEETIPANDHDED